MVVVSISIYEVEPMKILMIGNKESGKTTYMASAFGKMNNGISGFYIHTDSTTKDWFQRVYTQISNGNYPVATDKRGSYHFQLYHNQRSVLDFDWIDYNGGVITDTSIEELRSDIDSADGMMIFLDSVALLNNKMSTHRFRRIIALVTEKLEKNDNPLFSLIIVLTKYDKIPSDITFDQVKKPIQAFIDSANENDKLYIRVVPVSCSKEGFYNVELPLLDILDSGLKLSYIVAGLEAQAYVEQAQDYIKKSGLIDWGISKLFGMKTNGELATECATIAQERYELFQSLEVPTENLANYVSNYTIQFPHANLNPGRKHNNRRNSRFLDL